MRDVVYIDYETYYDDECSVSKLGPRAYVEHPDFDAYLVSIIAGSDEWVGDPREFQNWKDLEGMQPVAHNAMFDWEVFLWCARQKFHPDVFKGVPAWHCSAAVAASLNAPRSLAGAVKTLYDHELDKGMRTWMKGKRWKDAVAAGKAERLKTYALKDSRWGKRIYDEHIGSMPDWEVRLMEHTLRSGVIGCAVDLRYINASKKGLLRVIQKTEADLPWVKDGDKPTSTNGLARHCRAVGVEPPLSTAIDSPDLERWADEHEEIGWVRDMQKWRQANRMMGLLETLTQREVDGVFNYSTKFYGGHTGRWSGDGGFNMHNLPREPIMGVDLRGCFIARPECKLWCIDFAQIEARVLTWLADDTETLELLRQGFNMYEAHAAKTMGWKGEHHTLKKSDPKIYQLAKARVLGLGFGCGWKTFINAAKTMAGLVIDARTSKLTVNAYRATNKKVVDFWKALDLAFKRKCMSKDEDRTFEIELPSGRTLKYFNCMTKGGRCMAQAVRGARHIDWWGSKLTENVVQAVARDVLGLAVLRVEAQFRVPVLFTVHDELVAEFPEGRPRDPKLLESVVVESPPWALDLPIGCEMINTERYIK